MEYLFSFLIFLGMWALPPFLTAFLGLLIPIICAIIGFILGMESLILGIGGLCGSLLNIYATNTFIRTQGTMSHAPVYGKLASKGYVIVFLGTIIAKYFFDYQLRHINYWYLFLFAITAWGVLSFFVQNQRTQSINDFKKSVLKYKIVAKYEDDPKWAIYLYFNDGGKGWNQTVPGSFCAKNPENDFTFVFNSKDDALRYAQDSFKNSEYIKE